MSWFSQLPADTKKTIIRTAVIVGIGFILGFAFRGCLKPIVGDVPPENPPVVVHNGFGWRFDADQVEASVSRMPQPVFGDAARGIVGSWDGTNKLLYLAARKAIGHDIPCQYQTRGTCVSRAASAAVNYLSAVAIASGDHLEWKDVSHAFIYGCAKEIMNDVGPQNKSDRGDGLTGASAAEAVTRFGVVTDEEAGDDNNKDELAIKWAVSGSPAEMKALGKARLVKTTSRVTSFQQVADSIANGFPVVSCSQYGFEPIPATRDKDGFLRNKGNWGHAMLFIGVVNVNGRKGVVCLNSWGEKWVSGPNPLDMPAGCFCIDEKTVDGMMGGKMRDSFAYSNFVGFPRRHIDTFIALPTSRNAVAYNSDSRNGVYPLRLSEHIDLSGGRHVLRRFYGTMATDHWLERLRGF